MRNLPFYISMAGLILVIPYLVLAAEKRASEVAAEEFNVYKDKQVWKTADGKSFQWSHSKGKKTVFALFYTSCNTICPMTVENLKAIEKQLGPDAKNVQFVLMSVDAKYDTPKKMKSFAKKHGIANWKLLSGKARDVRAFAAHLGLGFEDKPGNEDLHQMHSRAFTFINKKGEIVGTLPSFEADFAKARELLSDTPPKLSETH